MVEFPGAPGLGDAVVLGLVRGHLAARGLAVVVRGVRAAVAVERRVRVRCLWVGRSAARGLGVAALEPLCGPGIEPRSAPPSS